METYRIVVHISDNVRTYREDETLLGACNKISKELCDKAERMEAQHWEGLHLANEWDITNFIRMRFENGSVT